MRYYITLIILLSCLSVVYSQDSTAMREQVRLNNHKIAGLKYRLKNLEGTTKNREQAVYEGEDTLSSLSVDSEEDLRKPKRISLKDKVDAIKRSDTIVLSRLTAVESKLDTLVIDFNEKQNNQQEQLDRIESYLLALGHEHPVEGDESALLGKRDSEGKRKKLHDFYESERINIQKSDSLDNLRWDYYVVVDTYIELNYAKYLQKKLQREYGVSTTVTQSGIPASPYYLVWSKKIMDKEDALKEVRRLNNLIDAKYISEGAWLYHRRKL